MKAVLLCCLCFISSHLFAQVADTSSLYRAIKTGDSLIFDIGFNTCNLAPYNDIFADDFHFYHDKGGVTIGKAAFIKDMQEGICKQENKVERLLVPGTMQVFPLYNKGVLYGAIENGDHAFYITEKGNPRYQDGIAKFTILWLLVDGKWKASQALSYDHRAK